MNISEIREAIMFNNLTNEELDSVVSAVRFAKARLAERSKQGLMIGDTVNFTSGRTGRNVTGTVTKIALKYVTVRTIDGLWKVPANMLSRVEEFA
jgi:small-conductance mechanosensitive channel